MEDFKIVRTCNHIKNDRNRVSASVELIRSEDEDYDIIDESNIVIKIVNVKNNLGEIIYRGDYQRYLHNKIQWVNAVITPGEEYSIDYIFLQVINSKYDESDCPLCNGNGWYISFTDMEFEIVEGVAGKYKLAQEFLRLLLTDIGTDRLDIDYGTNLGTVLDASVGREAENIILSSVARAEAYYMELQLGDTTIPIEEKLAKTVVNSIVPDEESNGYYVNMTLVTVAADKVSLGFSV